MASRDPAQPNVLFILSDDQGAWALGASGNDEILTPTLDSLAGEGTRFANFFCASPVCSPARASLLSGRIPSQHGVHDWIAGGHVGAEGVDYLAGQRLVTDALADAGYRCGLSGKWHLGANDRPRPGFVHWYAHQMGGGPYYGAPVVRNGQATTEPGYLTDAITADAVDFVNSEAVREEPFWLSVHYTAPHSPWKDNHPPEIVALYDDCQFRTCPQEPEHPWLRRNADGSPLARGTDLRAALQGYYAAITAMDAGIGRLLAALDDRDLRASTLVVFASDNGFSCGQHGIWGKGNGTFPLNMYEEAVKVPAIVRQPGRVPAGVVTDEMVSGYDVAPTVLEWLGQPPDDFGGSPGVSFADVLSAGGTGVPRDRVVVFDEYGPTRMIRTRDWKLVRRFGAGSDELYHLTEDPGERTNLVDDPARRATREELAGELRDWFDRHVDPPYDGWPLEVSGLGQLRPLALGDGPAFVVPAAVDRGRRS